MHSTRFSQTVKQQVVNSSIQAIFGQNVMLQYFVYLENAYKWLNAVA